MNRNWPLLLVLFLPILANSAVLPKGQYYGRIHTSFSTSSGLWVQDEKKDYTGATMLGNDQIARRNYYHVGVHLFAGMGNAWQLGGNITYGYANLLNAKILGAAEGDSNSQISEIGISATKSLVEWSTHGLYGFLKYSHPGQTTIEHPEFLSFNDYTSYLELGMQLDANFIFWQLRPLIKYRKSLSGAAHDQYELELKAYYRFNSRFRFGPALNYLHTAGGYNILDSGFSQSFQATGFLPVDEKKEEFLGLALQGDYLLDAGYKIDGYIHKKLTGKNTDDSLTVGLGLGAGF